MQGLRPPRVRVHRVTVSRGERGFSLLEMMFVVAVSMILLGMVIPAVFRTIRIVRLQESAIDYASLLQRARMRAVQDDRFYSVWVQPAAGGNPPIAYVDLNPKWPTGLSGHGNPANGGFYDPAPPTPDPLVTLSSEVIVQPVANAPAAAALNAAFCAACVAPGSGALILNSGPTWGSNGLPCQPANSLGGVGAGTVCNAAGPPVAYVTYLQSATILSWEAVTVTPAGRVQVWSYNANNATWSTH
jgi:type II secretory pathway pseudopilin PulG